MFTCCVDLLLDLALTVHKWLLGSTNNTSLAATVWKYFYNLCYSFTDFENDKIPFTNFGYELNVDPSNEIIDKSVLNSEKNLRLRIPDEFQSQWRSVYLYAGILNLAEIYKDRFEKSASAGSGLEGKNILEVGCGRGGGCLVLYGLTKPGSYLGVDLAETAVVRCRRLAEVCLPPAAIQCKSPDFKTGNSAALDAVTPANSIDIVFNVESSHCYPSFEKFVQSVYTILKPGGLFLWTDLQYLGTIRDIKMVLNRCGLKIKVMHDITTNVSESLRNGILDPLDKLYDQNYLSKSILHRLTYYIGWRLCARVAPVQIMRNKMTYHCIVCQKVVGDELKKLQAIAY